MIMPLNQPAQASQWIIGPISARAVTRRFSAPLEIRNGKLGSMNFSGPLLIFFVAAFVLFLAGAAIWVTRRTLLMKADEEADAKAFERSMTHGLGGRTI